MQKLQSIKEFQAENPDIVLTSYQLTYGGRNDVSLTHQDTPTQTEWNCADTDRTMYWDGTACSEPFRIYTEQP